jgi:ComF family protein
VPGAAACHALLAYEGGGRELVARLKYRNERGVVRALGRAMAGLVAPGAVDVVTWAPTTDARRRERGFDQARLLARGVARALRRPYRPLLRRVGRTPQTGLGRAERQARPAFEAARAARGRRVVVVDDVVTTGATMAAAVSALTAAGARSVTVLAAAHTPRRCLHSDIGCADGPGGPRGHHGQ